MIHLNDASTPHICGLVEVCGDRISRLHDFYDTDVYSQAPTEVQAGFSLAERHPERVG